MCRDLLRPLFDFTTWHFVPLSMSASIMLVVFSYSLEKNWTFRALNPFIGMCFQMSFHSTICSILLFTVQAWEQALSSVYFLVCFQSRWKLKRCIKTCIRTLVCENSMGLFMFVMPICCLELFVTISTCKMNCWMICHNVLI